MFLMVLLTFIVGVIAMITRFISLRSGQVRMGYFKLMEGQNIPERVTITTRCFNNMFEVPVLFYVACVLSVSLGVEGLPALVLAWLFVGFRFLQAFIHLTRNSLLPRMLSFWMSFTCVFLLWIYLLLIEI
jgi:hypothetical protein